MEEFTVLRARIIFASRKCILRSGTGHKVVWNVSWLPFVYSNFQTDGKSDPDRHRNDADPQPLIFCLTFPLFRIRCWTWRRSTPSCSVRRRGAKRLIWQSWQLRGPRQTGSCSSLHNSCRTLLAGPRWVNTNIFASGHMRIRTAPQTSAWIGPILDLDPDPDPLCQCDPVRI